MEPHKEYTYRESNPEFHAVVLVTSAIVPPFHNEEIFLRLDAVSRVTMDSFWVNGYNEWLRNGTAVKW